MEDRKERIERLVPLVLEDRRQPVPDERSGLIPWYFINVNHPAISPIYGAWMAKQGHRTAPSDMERTRFELSLLSNGALKYMEERYKREGRL